MLIELARKLLHPINYTTVAASFVYKQDIIIHYRYNNLYSYDVD